jgi:hypothetical protein
MLHRAREISLLKPTPGLKMSLWSKEEHADAFRADD